MTYLDESFLQLCQSDLEKALDQLVGHRKAQSFHEVCMATGQGQLQKVYIKKNKSIA